MRTLTAPPALIVLSDHSLGPVRQNYAGRRAAAVVADNRHLAMSIGGMSFRNSARMDRARERASLDPSRKMRRGFAL